jgi:hypothetical protein
MEEMSKANAHQNLILSAKEFQKNKIHVRAIALIGMAKI